MQRGLAGVLQKAHGQAGHEVRACQSLCGQVDCNVPSAKSAELLHGLNKPGIIVGVYRGSGHPLEDPPGKGNRLFREEALNAIRDFILATDH